MRCALWPDESPEELESELQAWAAGEETAAFFAEANDGTLTGFAEVSIHSEAPGCTTNRIGFLEGWYVDPAYRRQGIGRALNAAAEQWARERGCTEWSLTRMNSTPSVPPRTVPLGIGSSTTPLTLRNIWSRLQYLT